MSNQPTHTCLAKHCLCAWHCPQGAGEFFMATESQSWPCPIPPGPAQGTTAMPDISMTCSSLPLSAGTYVFSHTEEAFPFLSLIAFYLPSLAINVNHSEQSVTPGPPPPAGSLSGHGVPRCGATHLPPGRHRPHSVVTPKLIPTTSHWDWQHHLSRGEGSTFPPSTEKTRGSPGSTLGNGMDIQTAVPHWYSLEAFHTV